MKSRVLRRVFILILINSFTLSYAQNSDVNIYLDYARFRYDKDHVLLEIYYMVMPKTPKLEALRIINFELYDVNKKQKLAQNNVQIFFEKGNKENDATIAKQGMLKSILPEGKYKLKVSVLDGAKMLIDSVQYEIAISSFQAKRITLSDLEICKNIIPNSPQKNSDYFKNGLLVLPNPTHIFTLSMPRIYYYIEMYNVNASSHNAPYQIQIVIADTDGNIRDQKIYARSRKHSALVERGAFNIRKLETGLYTLIFAVTDSIENYSVYRRENFYVINPKVVAVKEKTNSDFQNSEYYTLPESIVDRMFEEAMYIATPEEIQIFKTLNDVEAKRKFLYEFWKKRTRLNPDYKIEYYERVKYANEHFTYAKIPGWKSDRGRVYILYGKPDQIERYPSEPNSLPYEIWFYYDIEGGVEFDFVDFSGFGDYRLVNSTKRNEYSDPNWRRLIRRNRF